MNQDTITPGKTTVAVDVLLTIAKLTTLNVPGVSRMSGTPTRRVKHMLHRQMEDGVEISVEDEAVRVDLFVVIEKDHNLREVGRNIQHEVARAISDMIGMQVGWINVHIEDIDYFVEN